MCDQAAVEQEANKWAELWDERAEYDAGVIGGACPAPPAPLQLGALRAATRTFPPGTGIGADGIAPRAIGRLSDEVLLDLCVLYAAIELCGSWPDLVNLVLIVLLPKPDGGLRPIGLFPTFIRVWMRAR